ncbi:uncharacterized protein LOC143888421 isoform X2 [Tasmannia lanceolata]|uniref:uncharacterized protein LOC143888421 isoform X2 n=1 Tax=Tasmannia lanceolata TaxID=3420 RepID=UPI0040637695
MGVDAKEIVVYVRKGVIFSIRTWFRSLCDHPFVWVMVFCSFLLYRLFPSLFGFLVSSSPTIVCTAVLLGTLLSFGQPNIPEVEEEDDKRSQEISSLKSGGGSDELVVEEDGSFALETHVEKRTEIEEKAIKETDLGVSFATRDAVEGKDEVLIGKSVVIDDDGKEFHREEKVIEEREFHEKQIEDVAKVGEDIEGQSTELKEIDGLTVEINKGVSGILDTHLDSHIDSSLGSPWKHIDVHDEASDSGSDRAESSSPDASMDDIMPMLDELHPLLDSETPKPTHITVDDSDSISEGSHESDDGSVELVEEAENQADEAAKEDQQDGTTVVVTWTEDDEKNLKDLGTSEIERNLRLETLIAKRSERKNRRFVAEKNLIDLDSNDSAQVGTSITDELADLQVHIPSVSTTRHNPFDIPYGSDEISGLPPIPGSAPSVLLPRRNPFDLLYDQAGERSTLMGESLGQQESLTIQQRDAYFRRHESFTLGASFPGEIKHEKLDVSLKPYFVPERLVSEETSYSTYQRQASEKSDSKVSSVPETDTVVDLDERKVVLERELSLEELISPTNHAAEPVERESESSEEVDSVEIEQEQSGSDGGAIPKIDLNVSNVNDEIQQDTEALERLKGEIIGEVVEEEYKGSSLSLLELNEKSFETNTEEGSGSIGEMRGDSSKWSSESVLSASLDSDLLSRGVEGVHDGQVVEPVYDSSPSAVEKTLSNMTTIEEDLFHVDKGILSSTSSIASDMHVEISSGGLPPILAESSTLPGGGESIGDDKNSQKEISSNERPWIASSNLSAVDDNESRSREVTEISECDVIQFGLSGVSQQHDDSTVVESEVDLVVHNSSSSSSLTELTVDDLIDEEAIDQSIEAQISSSSLDQEIHVGVPELDVKRKADAATSTHSDGLLSGGLTSLAAEDELAVFPSFEDDHKENQRKSSVEINDDNVNEFHEPEDSISSIEPPIVSVLNGDLTSLDIPNESMESSSFVDSKSAVHETTGDFSTHLNGEEANEKLIMDEDEEAEEIKDIDESLLSELDVVGDFSVDDLRSNASQTEKQLQSDVQSGEETSANAILDSLGHTEVKEYLPELSVLEPKSVEDIDIALREFSVGDSDKLMELQPVVDQTEMMESEVGSSKLQLANRNPDVDECSSELQVLEASSLADIDLAFKQLREGEADKSAVLESVGDESVVTETEAEYALKLADGDPSLVKTNPEVQVPEEMSLEDNDSGYIEKSLSLESIDEKPPLVESEAGSSKFALDEKNFKPTGIHSDIEVIEAGSLDDIHSVFKQLSVGNLDNEPKAMEFEDKSAEFEASERHLEPVILEVQSAKEIEAALKEFMARETGTSNEEPMAEKSSSEGREKFDDLSSGASLLNEKGKKAASGKSSSSSSSSSSDSD